MAAYNGSPACEARLRAEQQARLAAERRGRVASAKYRECKTRCKHYRSKLEQVEQQADAVVEILSTWTWG